MNADFIKLVHKIKADRGLTILTDVRTLRSLLADYAKGAYKGERRNFLLALEDGLVERMQSEPNISEAFLRTQASFFAGTFGLTEETGQHVIWSWAEVLGLHINGKPVLLQNASGTGSTSSPQAGQSQASPITPAHPPHPLVFTGKTHANSIGMEFVLIPAGTFMMGCPGSEPGNSDEYPIHQVTLTQPFYLGKFPVTQAQWQAVMGENPSNFEGWTRPVEKVSWNDTQDFIKKLNQREGANQYRLPTEAEWEYAARADSTTAYCFGDKALLGKYPWNKKDQLGQYAWYSRNSGFKTYPVGQKQPNKWGLYDMHGNVWEWCQDWYGAYPFDHVTDPTGPSSGARRVNRGGGWDYSAMLCRSAYRNHFSPGNRNRCLGFRLAFSPGR